MKLSIRALLPKIREGMSLAEERGP
jgi:hypothetical protein